MPDQTQPSADQEAIAKTVALILGEAAPTDTQKPELSAKLIGAIGEILLPGWEIKTNIYSVSRTLKMRFRGESTLEIESRIARVGLDWWTNSEVVRVAVALIQQAAEEAQKIRDDRESAAFWQTTSGAFKTGVLERVPGSRVAYQFVFKANGGGGPVRSLRIRVESGPKTVYTNLVRETNPADILAAIESVTKALKEDLNAPIE